MPATETDRLQQRYARAVELALDWLHEQQRSQAYLARCLGVDHSVLCRFLNPEATAYTPTPRRRQMLRILDGIERLCARPVPQRKGGPMPLSKADEERYLQALREIGQHPCRFEVSLNTLTILISALQLATRHPRLPARVSEVVRDWVEAAIEAIDTLAPDVAAGLRAGNDPANDV